MDFQAPSSQQVLDALKVAQCEQALFTFALWLTGIEADAKDLLQEAIYCMCDPTGGMPWDPDRSSVTTHARFVMKNLARKRWRASRTRREIQTDRDDLDDTYEHQGLPPDEAIDDARQRAEDRRRGELLRQRLNPLTRQVFEHRCSGIEQLAELARLCSCSVDEIRVANKLIVYHASAVLAEESRATREPQLRAARPVAKRKVRAWSNPSGGGTP
jgi:DNA-directed RNA polymerase specialized sigma24 family protein